MPRHIVSLVVIVIATLHVPATAQEAQTLRAQFASPPREYSSGPLWTWNDRLTVDQVRGTLRDLAAQHVKQVWVHPRPGLMTPYLSPEWFKMWDAALDEAKKLDMNVWIYDENSYPSGFGGGLVPEALPDSRAVNLVANRQSKLPSPSDENVLRVFVIRGNRYEQVGTETHEPASKKDDARSYLVVRRQYIASRPWFGGKWYVDLLRSGVTEKFLEITLEPYRQRYGELFGDRIPGSFTDEPGLAMAGGLPWTPDLPKRFERRWGYSLLDNLPALFEGVGDWRRVRHDYFQLVLDQFIEHWAKPYSEYCEKHGLQFTGHYWEHEWPNSVRVPDNMAMYAWHQRPAIDTLFNRYAENTHAQFGNVRAVRELASVASQYGRKRTLCEAYGAGGWGLRFEDMKRIGDWLYVLGVNTLNEHLSYVTIRGARKRDHPQSFSYHEPWWDDYHTLATYFTRLSLALTTGQQVHETLILEPTTTAWFYQRPAGGETAKKLETLGDSFFSLLMELERRQVEYDLGCEDILARIGSVSGTNLVVGKRSYRTVVIPPGMENLNGPTTRLLVNYVSQGGTVLCCAAPPKWVDGRASKHVLQLAQSKTWKQITPAQLADLLLQRQNHVPRIERAEQDKGILFHHRRLLGDDQMMFLVNTSAEHASRGTIVADAAGVEQWDLHTGQISAYPFQQSTDGIKVTYHLEPCGSLLLMLTAKPQTPSQPKRVNWHTVQPAGELEIERVGPNVLTLDYVDIAAGDQKEENLYYFHAEQFAFQKNGMEANPWDRAVQLRDTIITKKFPPDSSVQATYRFRIDGKVPDDLRIVIERADLYSVTCNGKGVEPLPDVWWLDKSFRVIDLHSVARAGENRVTIGARPMTIWNEIAPAYVLGDFSLRVDDAGFVIQPPRTLGIASAEAHGFKPDGTMWLSAGVGYGKDAAGKPRDDRQPFLVFDLGKPVVLEAINIWNYNENHVTTMMDRGVQRLRVSGSSTGEPGSFTIDLGTHTLRVGNGAAALADRIETGSHRVRYVRFDVLSNHAGVTFPVQATEKQRAFAGLAEVQFLVESDATPLKHVRMAQVSSELAQHNRLAKYLLDGSGLHSAPLGWDQQGHPFYGHDVIYRRHFVVKQAPADYRVVLGPWYGSVAKVRVNGKLAGHIGWRPWAIDVGHFVQPGRNTIEVIVTGTLKNTLGPHHIAGLRGIAGPAHFQAGPKRGPPPGKQYDTIGYGLFEPFELQAGSPSR